MRIYIKVFCCLCLLFGYAGVHAEEQDISETGVSSVLRTTIFVRDLDSALGLFQKILGLKIRADLPLEGKTINEVLGTTGKKARITILQSGDDTIGNIALFTYPDDPAPPEQTHDAKLDVGEVAVVMNTTKIEAIYERVKAEGYTIVSPPMVLFPVEDMISQTKEMVFIGPEGVAINLIQRGTPAEETGK